MNSLRIRALTLDLDDTLWPVWPAIARAQQALHTWLGAHAPTTAARFDIDALAALRIQVLRDRPQLAHDMSALRLESVRLALSLAGDDPTLAEPAFEAFFSARMQVDLYPDVPAALRRLSSRYPLLAVTNGNADIGRIGLAQWFVGTLSAGEFGVGKPDPRIYVEACRRLGVGPTQVLHVGDDPLLDVAASRSAGLHCVWLRRAPAGDAAVGPEVTAVADLEALADLLGC